MKCIKIKRNVIICCDVVSLLLFYITIILQFGCEVFFYCVMTVYVWYDAVLMTCIPFEMVYMVFFLFLSSSCIVAQDSTAISISSFCSSDENMTKNDYHTP